MPLMVIAAGLLFALLSACAEGRWVQVGRSDAKMLDDWTVCKEEVLTGEEHRKDTLAGGINLSGCMHSKGYRYVEEEAGHPPAPTPP